MQFTIFGDRKVEIDDIYNRNYRKTYGELLTDSTVQYFATTGECTPDMDDNELADMIQKSIDIELGAVHSMPETVREAKSSGVINDGKERQAAEC